MNPIMIKEDISSGLGSNTLLARFQKCHLSESINDHEDNHYHA
jgi:hypothetical protein